MATEEFRFARFTLSEMVVAASRLRAAAEQAGDFTAAAHAVVHRLHAGFVDEDGAPVLPLVRLFTTRRWADLSADQRALTAGEVPDPGTRCLVLEATTGTAAAWRQVETSVRHRVVPLASARTATDAPLMSALAARLGVTGGARGGGRFGVFHVAHAPGSPDVPAQDFVADHGIRSVLGFGGLLAEDDMFAVVMFSTAPITAAVATQFQAVAVSVRAGLLAHAGDRDGTAAATAQRDALGEHLELLEDAVAAQAAELERAVARLSAEAQLVDQLQSVGRRLTAQLDMDTLVQDATDSATQATGAAFGAFFYNVTNDLGESYTLFTISGVPREEFAKFPMPRNTAVFDPTFSGEGVVRSDDITADPRYGRSGPHHGMPKGHLPVRSYLAVPAVSPTTGEVLGGFFFGHPETGRFTARHQQLAEGVAGYAAIALDNAHLYRRQRAMATELQRSMLPKTPEVPGFAIVSRYLPAATGSEVGGDWFDVISLPAGRTAFVVGDVMGRGVPAAAIMGRVRTAVLSYAKLDLPPAEILRHVSELVSPLAGHQFITCAYAVHDPADASLTYASAGHLPPAIILPGGGVTLLTERLGLPRRIGTEFQQRQVPFPAGAALALYTDGLVERRDRTVDDGIAELSRALTMLAAQPATELGAGCDKLIDELTGRDYDDDIALLYARDLGRDGHHAGLPLATDDDMGVRARAFIRTTLTGWGLPTVIDAATAVAIELISNAVRHAVRPGRLSVYQRDGRLVITATDYDQRLPRRATPGMDDTGHRGLVIVEAYADRWGTRPTPDGKAVWAELPLP